MRKLTFEVPSFQHRFGPPTLESGIRSELQELAENERDIGLGLQSLRRNGIISSPPAVI
jgi:hypothetical protein